MPRTSRVIGNQMLPQPRPRGLLILILAVPMCNAMLFPLLSTEHWYRHGP